MIDEIKAHTNAGHWEIISRSDVPIDKEVTRGVWSMKRKRKVATGEIYK